MNPRRSSKKRQALPTGGEQKFLVAQGLAAPPDRFCDGQPTPSTHLRRAFHPLYFPPMQPFSQKTPRQMSSAVVTNLITAPWRREPEQNPNAGPTVMASLQKRDVLLPSLTCSPECWSVKNTVIACSQHVGGRHPPLGRARHGGRVCDGPPPPHCLFLNDSQIRQQGTPGCESGRTPDGPPGPKNPRLGGWKVKGPVRVAGAGPTAAPHCTPREHRPELLHVRPPRLRCKGVEEPRAWCTARTTRSPSSSSSLVVAIFLFSVNFSSRNG